MASFIKIPRDIKQQFLPFKLKSTPGIFSFKNIEETQGKINICPQSIEQYITQDISFRSIFDQNQQNFSLASLYDSIPGIQIREYLPDTRLDQALNFFTGIFNAIQDAFKSQDRAGSNDNSKKFEATNLNSKEFFDKITKVAKYAVQFMTGSTDDGKNFYKSMGNAFYAEADKRLNSFNVSDMHDYVLGFPYTMWYLLQSSITTNVYELPGITDDKELYKANGHAGWEGSAGFSLVGENSPFSFLNTGGMIGKVINSILGNVNISFMPWWDAKKGNATPFTDVKIKIDLFNDTAQAAAMNFIFVNTLIPNAKWIQYNLFQHSPNIYDIKLDGYKRLYACSGDFSVKYGGILRDINEKWFNDNLLKYANMNLFSSTDKIVKNKLIKIPDIYHVEMTFKSLLPDTFNNSLYPYSSSNIITEDAKEPVVHESAATKAVTAGIGALAKALKEKWDE